MNAGLFRVELKLVVRAYPLCKPGDAPYFTRLCPDMACLLYGSEDVCGAD